MIEEHSPEDEQDRRRRNEVKLIFMMALLAVRKAHHKEVNQGVEG
jgi:hypothetical protein